jgi:plastocyanin
MRLKNLVSSFLLSSLVGLGCSSGSSTTDAAGNSTGGKGGGGGSGGSTNDASSTGTGGSGGGSGGSMNDASTTGTGGGSGGSVGGAFMAIAPCPDMTSYVTGMTTITTTADFKYSPACLKVTTGTMVTIQASLTHPLSGLTTGSANNPIPAGGMTTDQMVTFATPGFYPFHCNIHFSIGMSGVVWVQ